MYEKLARGHATAYINNLQDYRQLLNWLDGSGGAKAIDAFECSSFSKKPGRVLKRLTPLLRPHFHGLKIYKWTRQLKGIAAMGVASSAENRVFRLPDDTRPLYSERAVFLSDLLLAQRDDMINYNIITRSSISHHAIARLVERGGVSPTNMTEDIVFILLFCRTVATMTLATPIDHSAMMSFMLPFKEGALVAVLMDMNPAQMQEANERGCVLSVRTWLDSGKLSDLDLERMGGLDGLKNVMKGDYGAVDESFLRWIEGNARPWQFSDSTLGDQGQSGM